MTVMVPKTATRYRIVVDGEELYYRTRGAAEGFLTGIFGGAEVVIQEVEVRPAPLHINVEIRADWLRQAPCLSRDRLRLVK